MNHQIVIALYAALAAGDRAGVETCLAPGFEAAFTDGLPLGIGGTHIGHDAIDHGWWAIGRAFALTAEPSQYIDTADGRLLVLGVYRGRARATGASIEAAFMHLWAADGDHLTNLLQLTDSAQWLSALADTTP
jgi:ketosteroid isomerase-like protein